MNKTLTVGLALSISAGTAMADEATSPTPAPGSTLLEEIVVTAQFRQQSLETTPVAITALTGAQLDERNVQSLVDINGLAPNVTLTKGTNTNGPSAQAFIRGIGQSDGHPGLEPGVGIYVDDVYHGLLLGSDLDVTDLDRIEVLRGPQGTLAGKNSIGGSIKLFSKKPGEDTDGYIDATYGDFQPRQDQGRRQLHARSGYAVCARLGRLRDAGRLHAAARLRLRDGPDVSSTQIPVHGCQLGTEGGTALHAVSLALRWLVNDKIENNFIATDTQDRSEVPALKLLHSATTPGHHPDRQRARSS